MTVPLSERVSEDTRVIVEWASQQKEKEGVLTALLIAAAKTLVDITPAEALNTRLVLEAAEFKRFALSLAEEKAKKQAEKAA